MQSVCAEGACVEGACVEIGLKKSWEVREGKCCWREDCNCSCTCRAVTSYLLPAPIFVQCLSDVDAGLNTLCLSQVFCYDAGWRLRLRGCARVYHLCCMPVCQVVSLFISVKGERMDRGLEAYQKASDPHWLHGQPWFKENVSCLHCRALQKQSR